MNRQEVEFSVTFSLHHQSLWEVSFLTQQLQLVGLCHHKFDQVMVRNIKENTSNLSVRVVSYHSALNCIRAFYNQEGLPVSAMKRSGLGHI